MKSTKIIITELKTKYDLTEYECKLLIKIRKKRSMITTINRHTAKSGMSRIIDFYMFESDERTWLTPIVSKLTGYNMDKKYQGLKVGGCGMDMGFAVVYSFSRKLFPDGFRYKKKEYHRNNDPSYKDPDGGYALKQEWL